MIPPPCYLMPVLWHVSVACVCGICLWWSVLTRSPTVGADASVTIPLQTLTLHVFTVFKARPKKARYVKRMTEAVCVCVCVCVPECIVL